MANIAILRHIRSSQLAPLYTFPFGRERIECQGFGDILFRGSNVALADYHSAANGKNGTVRLISI